MAAYFKGRSSSTKMSWRWIFRYAFKPIFLGTHNVNTVIILGLASRLCDGDPAMWHDPNVENCSTVEITNVRETVNNLMENSNDSLSKVVENITEELARGTEKNITIFPNDLQNVINITRDIIRLICQ